MRFKDILAATEAESGVRRKKEPIESLKEKVCDLAPCRGFGAALAGGDFSVIAEVKTKSPSMGKMSASAEQDAVVAHKIYDCHPVVSAISVLTQRTHFGGSEEALRRIRGETSKPILRKDFIWDEYEVFYSRCMGADAILLMANVVTDPGRFAALYHLAGSLGMDVLCEVHAEKEIGVLPLSAKICGINSRNFKSSRRFLLSRLTRRMGMDASVDMAAFDLCDRLPAGSIKVAESGLTASNIGDVLSRYHFDAALIGTSLLRAGAGGLEGELDKLKAAIDGAASSMESAVAAKR